MWLLVGVLTVLLGLLAMLQYRWTGEIGRAEAERQQHRLERSARRFAQELRHEVGRVALAFRPDFRGRSGDVRTDQLDRLARWQQTRHAELVSRLVVLTRSSSGELLVDAADLGADALASIPLPAGLESVQQRLEAAGDQGRRAFRWDWRKQKQLARMVRIV